MVNTDYALRKNGLPANIVMWVHDELQIEVEETQAELVSRICVASAETVTDQLKLRVPVAAVAKIGLNWYETH